MLIAARPIHLKAKESAVPEVFTAAAGDETAKPLEEAKVPHDAEVYGGARHSFTVSGSRDYDEQADAKSWDALVRFLNRQK